ncbi:kinase-like domain-containing protein [Lipomyces japonicus]|uniref:kinase-like domain-containing protein n=1 Tax=Lipomyces japonicus TaxID=56871 RepID=UPI0034CD4295
MIANPALEFEARQRIGTVLDSRLELTDVLGVGAYGVVFSAVDVASAVPYAVKAMLRNQQSGQPFTQPMPNDDTLDRETALLSLVHSHPNIVSVLQVLDLADGLYVVMEYCPEGDLFSNITEKKLYVGNDHLATHVFLQIVDAVWYCHSVGVCHRDLKPENVLVCTNGREVKLSDFGLATTDPISYDFGCGSSFYMSPECLTKSITGYDPVPNDVWALGVILVNLTCGQNPWKMASASDASFQAFLRSPKYLQRILPVSDELNLLLNRMFDIDPARRITIPEIVASMSSIGRLTVSTEEHNYRVKAMQAGFAATSSAPTTNSTVATAVPVTPPPRPPRTFIDKAKGILTPLTPSVPTHVSCSLSFSSSSSSSSSTTSAAASLSSSPITPHSVNNPFRNRADVNDGLGIKFLDASMRFQQMIWGPPSQQRLHNHQHQQGRPISGSSFSSTGSWANSSSPATSSPSTLYSDLIDLNEAKLELLPAFPGLDHDANIEPERKQQDIARDELYDAAFTPASQQRQTQPVGSNLLSSPSKWSAGTRRFSMSKMLSSAKSRRRSVASSSSVSSSSRQDHGQCHNHVDPRVQMPLF